MATTIARLFSTGRARLLSIFVGAALGGCTSLGPEVGGLDLGWRAGIDGPDLCQCGPMWGDASEPPDLASPGDLTIIPPAGWKLVWNDEFDGPNGSAADPAKWKNDTGGGGWGNQEREYYTAGNANAKVESGALLISTLKDGGGNKCWYGPCEYTSARLVTKGLFSQLYGRFEVRAKIPFGQGIWPAFWALGANIDSVSWPTCGELDIMESVGREPGRNHGSAHGPGYSGGNPLTSTYDLAAGTRFADDFHTFAIEWEAGVVRWYVDDHLYETRTPADVPKGKTWVYDHPFFLILNVAVGGTFPGAPDQTSTYPQTMTVDWVRVFGR